MHELADCRQDGGDGVVVGDEFLLDTRFELIEALGQLPVRREQLRAPPRPSRAVLFEVANCDLKTAASWAERRNMKSSGKRRAFRFTASFRRLVVTP